MAGIVAVMDDPRPVDTSPGIWLYALVTIPIGIVAWTLAVQIYLRLACDEYGFPIAVTFLGPVWLAAWVLGFFVAAAEPRWMIRCGNGTRGFIARSSVLAGALGISFLLLTLAVC